jgi:ATP-binding cassette subfamily C protein
LNTYSLLFHDIITRLRWRFPLLIALTALVGLGEGISMLLFLPLLKQLGIAASGSQGSLVRLLDEGLARVGASSLARVLAVIIAIALVQTLLNVFLIWWTAVLAQRYVRQRQMELFRAFMRAKWLFVAERKAGELSNAIITECGRAGAAFTICLALLGGAVVTMIYVVLALNITWQVTLVLIGFAVLAALLMVQLYRRTSALGQNQAPLNAELHSLMAEHFAGAKYIKAIAGEERASERTESVVKKLERALAAAGFLPNMTRSGLEFLAFVGIAGILVVGSGWMAVAAGNVMVVLALFGRLFPRLTAMQAQMHSLNWYAPAINVIDAFQTGAEAEAERADSPGAPRLLEIDLPTDLTVRGVEVKFGERKALAGVDLWLPVPGLTAVVGGSGAGKSTLVHTLLGLTEPSAGSIRLGNVDFDLAPLGAWRRALGYVPQETILFHASIRDNLIFANPAASEQEVEMAARRAHAHDFIMTLPEGYDAVIGDQGVKLSGGQRQRLGIARALLTNPLLLILDEAMSALDAESETEIMRTLGNLRKEMGIIMIAHRLSSIRTADMIYVFEGGRVAESGIWDDLMRQEARFFKLAQAQGLERQAAH